MAFVQRANVVLEIKESEVDRYVDLGYNLISEDGKILKEAVPSDAPTLKVLYTKALQEIKEKDTKIAELQAALAAKDVDQTSKEPESDTEGTPAVPEAEPEKDTETSTTKKSRKKAE